MQSLALSLFLCFAHIGLCQYSLDSCVKDSASVTIIDEFAVQSLQAKVAGTKIHRSNMAIFCKLELDVQDQSKFPIKFRLGSQDYVDILENKVPIYKKKDY